MDALCKFDHQGHPLEISVIEEEWPIAALPGLDDKKRLAPAAVTLTSLTLSCNKIAPGEALTLSAQLGRPDVTLVYLELLLRDPHREQYYGPVCQEPIAAPHTKTIGSVQFPAWSETPVAQATIEPFLRLLTDGQIWAFGFLKPRAPKSPPARVGYKLEALYRPARGRRQNRAQVSFDATGEAKSVLVFGDLGGRAAPRSLNPHRYDRFTPLLQCYRPANEAGVAARKAFVQSNTLKWRDHLRWQAAPLVPGTYLVGLVAKDLDGQLHRRYAELVVEEG
jgi:hypothetical protein